MEVDGMAPWMSIFLHFHEYSQGVYVQEFRPSFLHTFLLAVIPRRAVLLPLLFRSGALELAGTQKTCSRSGFHPGFILVSTPFSLQHQTAADLAGRRVHHRARGRPQMGATTHGATSRFGQI